MKWLYPSRFKQALLVMLFLNVMKPKQAKAPHGGAVTYQTSPPAFQGCVNPVFICSTTVE